MAKAPTSYAGNLARAVGQGVTFGFGDELEAGVRSLVGDRSYDEEVADIRKSISQFRDTNPVAAYGSEIAGSIPTGFGLAGLALRGGLKGAAKIGALEGSIYGAGEGEGVEGTATSTALGAGLGAAGGKIAEKAFEGIAPLVGKFMKKTRGSGIEAKGSGNIEMEASPSDLGPLVKEAGSDGFVPLEKKVGAPGTPGVERNINPALQEDVFVGDEALGGIDYLPAAQALLENPPGMSIGKKGLTGAQYLARLKNQPSVTDMELETSGLDKFLTENANRKIPVDDVLDFHMGNSPRIEMVDGGTRHVADQRMFGDESFVMQGKDQGGGYEEVVFRDAKFAAGDIDLAPGAFHSASHHSEQGAIGHGRMTSFNDATPGAKAGSESTMLEENQYDLFDVYKGGAAREAEAERLKALREGREPSLPPTNLVQLTPEKVKTFKAIEQKIEDGAGYRTLNDALTSIDDETRMLKEIQSNQRTHEADFGGVRRRNIMFPRIGTNRNADAKFGEQLRDLSRVRLSPTDRAGLEMRVESDFDKLIKQSVIEDSRALDTLSDDQLQKVLKLATDRSLRLGEGSSLRIKPVIRAPLNDAELKEVLNIPVAKNVAEEDALIAAGRLIDNVQNEFKNVFEQSSITNTLARGAAPGVMERAPFDEALAQAKNLLPKVVGKIDPKLLRKDAASYRKLSSEDDLFKQSIDDQEKRIRDAKDRVMNIYGDAIEGAAPNKQTAFEYAHYRQNQGKLAIDGGRFNTMATRFSQDPIDFSDGSVGFQDVAPEFTNPLPFETQEQVARYQLHQMIKKAAGEGKGRFYIPDYRDLAEKRGVFITNDATSEKELAPYVSRYKTPQEKVIKELKEMYPDIDIGTVDKVQPTTSVDLDPTNPLEGYKLQVERPENEFPMTYIDLTPLQAKPSQVRRYKDGGKVDLRSGIGDIFKVYS
jgi:hypothetical protein